MLVRLRVAFPAMDLYGLAPMPDPSSLKRFTVSLEAEDYEALCALARSQRPALSLQYMVRLAIRRFLDESEGRTITLAAANPPANRSKR